MELINSFLLIFSVGFCIDIGCTIVEYANDIWKIRKMK